MNKYKTSKIESIPESNVLKGALRSLFSTTIGTVSTTVALVGIHHYYRKQQQPEARLQDYVTGIRAQARSIPFISLAQITRLQYVAQQAKHAYQNYPKNGSNFTNIKSKVVNDLLALHTTTLLSRPVCWVSGVASMPKSLSLANENDDNDFGVVGIDRDRQIVWQTTMPERVHDIVVQPASNNQLDNTEANIHQADSNQIDNTQAANTSISSSKNRDVVVMGRRPSEGFWVLDTATGQVLHAIKSASNRHFYGHACYSLDGLQLYVTENDTVSLDGKIGVYDVTNGYQKMAEFDSYGIGPHELIIHPDGETLIVANGGIKTEQASREELNLDSMRPSLVYLNRHNGQLLEQIIPEHNQMSIRHLAMHDNGMVIIGIQFQGERHINVPLVLTHQRGDAGFTPLTMPNHQWQRFHQYIASVAVDSDHNLLCVTTPIGGCAAIYDLTTRQLIEEIRLPDCAGASTISVLDDQANCPNFSHVAPSANDDSYHKKAQAGFIVSDGQGQLTTLYANGSSRHTSHTEDERANLIISDSKGHKMSFDNHLQAL